jgi:hypothetical protein
VLQGSDNCKKLLIAMCHGIKDGDIHLGVTTVDLYQSTERKVLFILNRDILLDMIKRRADSHILHIDVCRISKQT